MNTAPASKVNVIKQESNETNDKPKETVVIAPFRREIPEEVMQLTAAALDIRRSAAWGISDYDPVHKLVNVRYIIKEDGERCTPAEAKTIETVQPGTLGWLRGVVVDLETGAIVCRSFPYTPTVTVDALITEKVKVKDKREEETRLTFKEDSYKHHSFHRWHIQRGYEGLVIRVFKVRGVVHFSSHRRLSIGNFKRDNHEKSAMEIYRDLGGPNEEQLFSESPTSPFVHLFVICHHDLIFTSRDELGDGYLVYLGHRQMDWLVANPCPYPKDEIETTPRKIQAERYLKPGQSRIIKPEIIKLADANEYIKGHLPNPKMDPRLSCGGFLIVTCLNDADGNDARLLEDPKCGRQFRIQGCAQTWRDEMNNCNVNVGSRYCELLDEANILYSQGLHVYFEFFPKVAIPKDVEKQLPIRYIDGKPTMIVDTKTREAHVLTCLLLAVPFARQLEVTKSMERLAEKKRCVDGAAIEFISQLGTEKPTYLGKYFEDLRNKIDVRFRLSRPNKKKTDPEVYDELYAKYIKELRGKLTDRSGVEKFVNVSIKNLTYKRLYKVAKDIGDARQFVTKIKLKEQETRKKEVEDKLKSLLGSGENISPERTTEKQIEKQVKMLIGINCGSNERNKSETEKQVGDANMLSEQSATTTTTPDQSTGVWQKKQPEEDKFPVGYVQPVNMKSKRRNRKRQNQNKAFHTQPENQRKQQIEKELKQLLIRAN